MALCGPGAGAAARADGPGTSAPQLVSIDFRDAAVPDVVRFYAELLDRNFVLGPDLAEVRITIIAPRPVSPAEAWEALVTALAQRGLSVQREGKFWRIAKVRASAPLSPGTNRYALRYASSADVAAALQGLAGAGVHVVAWPDTNSVIVVGSPAAARRLFRVARALDQPGARRQVYVVELEHADADSLAKTLRTLLDD